MRSKRGLTALAVLLIGAPLAARQEEPGRAAAPHPPYATPYAISRAQSPIQVDGRLDEPAWQSARVVELSYETRPAENTPPPVKTECLITYDDDRIYVAFRAQDPEPAKIRAHISDRDNAYNDDFVGILLDPFNDERRGFEFFVNPLGVQMDLFMDDVSNNEDDSWDALWWSAGRITESGYVVEMAIPFSSLRFPRAEGEQTWGFDALRFYPRQQRHRLAAQPMDRNVSCYLCQVSKMTGFAGVTPGRNVEVDPTVTSVRSDLRGALSAPLVAGDTSTDPGLTAKWGVTPNLTLNAALNPDFSQVEADAAQLDVNTTFALFFPEKRPFFLEGADFFRTPFEAVFTRNVADPSWGGKLTGKEGKNAMGLFVAQDDRTDFLIPGSESSRGVSLDVESTDAVLRYRRDLGAASALGLLATSRQGDGYSNRLGGVDGLYRINDVSTVRGQYLRSRTEYPAAIFGDAALRQSAGGLDDRAFYLGYNHSSRNWNAYARYEDVGDLFRADLGFMPQVDYTFKLAGLEHFWYGPDDAQWTKVAVGSDWDDRQDQAGNLLERELEAWVDVNGPLQSFIWIDGGTRNRAFNGVTFDQTFVNLYGEVQPTGDLFLSLSAKGGDEVDYANTRAGKFREVEPFVRFLPGRHVRVQVSHLIHQLDVDGGRLFEANLSQLRLVYQFNVRTFVRLISQYTDVRRNPDLYLSAVDRKTDRLFNQLLFSYKLNPQTVFFAGYSDNSLANPQIDLTRIDRTFFLKIGYAWVP